MVFFGSRSNLPMSKLYQIYHHLNLIIDTPLSICPSKMSVKQLFDGGLFDNWIIRMHNIL